MPADSQVPAALAWLLGPLPPDVGATFTPAQLAALETAVRPAPSRHLIDYRVSLPGPRGRGYYLTVLMGRERRNAGRLAREGQHRPSRLLALAVPVALMLLGLALVGAISILYVLKSVAGIDLIDGDSALHPLFEQLFQ